MTYSTYLLLWPIVVAAHNIEKLSRHDSFIAAYHARLDRRWAAAGPVRIAATLLTAAIAAISVEAWRQGFGPWLQVTEVTMAAFAVNAIGHCIRSARRRSLLPGTPTALFLVLPYCLIAIPRLVSVAAESARTLAIMAGIGLIVGPPAILLFFALGYATYAAYAAVRRQLT